MLLKSSCGPWGLEPLEGAMLELCMMRINSLNGRAGVCDYLWIGKNIVVKLFET